MSICSSATDTPTRPSIINGVRCVLAAWLGMFTFMLVPRSAPASTRRKLRGGLLEVIEFATMPGRSLPSATLDLRGAAMTEELRDQIGDR